MTPVTAKPIIAGITLDVDGTLYDIRRMMLLGVDQLWPVRSVFRDLFRVRDSMRGQGPFDQFRAEQARRLAARRKIAEGEAARLVEETIDRRWMKVFARVRPYRGLVAVLERLSGCGLPLGVISEYPARPKLAALGLGDVPFDTVIVCEEVGALKPHPVPFQAALRSLGLPAEQVLHIGDREDSDVDGALAAGMRAALLCRGAPSLRSRADFTFSDWRHFLFQFEGHFQVAPSARAKSC